MDSQRIVFGTEMRQRRLAAGHSLATLSALVHYSRSHLSKVETGAKPPSPDLARRCDAALDCDGALSRLAPQPTIQGDRRVDEDGEVWVMALDQDGGNSFGVVSRRWLLAGGAAAVGGWMTGAAGLDAVGGPPSAPAEPTVASFRAIFDQVRRLGQTLPPGALVPMLAAQVHTLAALAATVRVAERARMLSVAATYAEYAGWLTQEAGDDTRAAWWTARAVDFADGAGDPVMRAYALVRRGLIAMYRHDATATIDLARQSQASTGHPRVRFLALQREAQGHALAGDYNECMRCLDRARVLGPDATGPVKEPVLGTSQVVDPVAATTGWCLFDLGKPSEAAAVLRCELDRIAPDALRARARYGARLALALAGSGEPTGACDVLEPVLDAYPAIASATIRSDLRRLSGELNRWHRDPRVRDARIRLTAALYEPVRVAG